MAAKTQNRALPHILLKGPAGTGKTTLAEVVAREFGTVPMALTPGTAKKAEDLRKLFLRMPEDGYDNQGEIIGKIQPQIVFVDECHQLPLLAQENLGIAMQDWKLPVRVSNQDVFEWVPRFTLIGATTLPGKLSKPFLDRFKIQSEFETYAHDESVQVTELHANIKGLQLTEGVADAIARRSRGVPRLVVRYIDWMSDAAVNANAGDPSIPANLIT
jgi:Holliday junction DNA helicase RuvB